MLRTRRKKGKAGSMKESTNRPQSIGLTVYRPEVAALNKRDLSAADARAPPKNLFEEGSWRKDSDEGTAKKTY